MVLFQRLPSCCWADRVDVGVGVAAVLVRTVTAGLWKCGVWNVEQCGVWNSVNIQRTSEDNETARVRVLPA